MRILFNAISAFVVTVFAGAIGFCIIVLSMALNHYAFWGAGVLFLLWVLVFIGVMTEGET